MVSTVGARPNHYEVLGLTPAATDQEIADAFARLMSIFRARPLSAIAQLSAAFETLRNPAKRKAYDRSLGLAREPEPRPWAIAARHDGRPFFGLPPTPPASPQVRAPAPAAQARTPPPPPEAPAERRVAPFIAAALREPVPPKASEAPQPTPLPDPVPTPQPTPLPDPVPVAQATAEPRVEPKIEEILAAARAAIPSDAEAREAEWKRPAMIVGGVILGVGILGAWAGVSAGGDAQQSQNEAVTVAVPAAKPAGKAVAAAATPTSQTTFEAVAPEPRVHRQAARRYRSRQPVAFEAKAVDQAEAAASTTQDSGSLDSAVAAAVAQPAPTEAVPATMPLPGKVIARTIERIGYACGGVASTSAVEGAHGVYNVTCTSGQSYRASPVRGRYHFRRVGSH